MEAAAVSAVAAESTSSRENRPPVTAAASGMVNKLLLALKISKCIEKVDI
jgi:hypothetical protein